jgi:hypothetical protein
MPRKEANSDQNEDSSAHIDPKEGLGSEFCTTIPEKPGVLTVRY